MENQMRGTQTGGMGKRSARYSGPELARVGWRLGWSLACILIAANARVAAAEGYLSPETLVASADGKTLYVAEATANLVVAFDPASGKITKQYALPDPPSGLALSPDGTRLYVTGASPAGRLHVFDVRSGKLLISLPAGHTPTAPVLRPDGKTLYLCNRFNDNVAIIDLNDNKQVATIPVTREPVAAALTPDGKTLFVANLLPAGRADAGDFAAVVSVISTAEKKVTAAIKLPNGSTSVYGLCVSPDGQYVFVTHVLGRYQLPTTQLDRGWVNTNALSVIDASRPALVNTVLLDDVDRGAANSWGVACSADGKYLCVAHSGTHEVSVIDRVGLHDRLARAAAGENVTSASSSAEDVKNDLSFMVGLRRRVKLAGIGPRGLAIAGSTLYTAEYFSDSIGVVPIDPEVQSPARSLPLGPQKSLTTVRRGEMLFHDATICFQHWQSCATCHPGAARTDGLNWDLLNDGIGSPRSSRSLLLAHRTPPAMSMGVRTSAEMAVRAGITHVLFSVRPPEDAAAIDEYLKSLKPVLSPHLVTGELNPSAERGRKIFEEASCSRCHPAPLYTDLKPYDVGTGRGADANARFDTPTLVEVWRTAPYLHDGRAATIQEVLTTCNAGDEHGATSRLTPEQIKDLAEFVLSQ